MGDEGQRRGRGGAGVVVRVGVRVGEQRFFPETPRSSTLTHITGRGFHSIRFPPATGNWLALALTTPHMLTGPRKRFPWLLCERSPGPKEVCLPTGFLRVLALQSVPIDPRHPVWWLACEPSPGPTP